MPFFKIAHTYAERKQIRQFWENARKQADEIYNEYTDSKENRFHTIFYKNIRFEQENFISRPAFFEPIYTKK
jgi:hypothetical protein